MLSTWVSVWVLSLLLEVDGMYFLVKPQVRCMTFDLPKDTPMVFTYEVMDAEHSVGLNIYYGSEANSELRILGKKIHQAGHIDFSADNEGEYSICMSQSSVYDIPTVRTSIQ